MRVLVFAPHPDDEVLGCGGTIKNHSNNGDEVYVCIVTSGKPPVFDNTIAVQNGWPHTLFLEAMAAKEVLGIKDYIFLELPCVLLEREPRNEVNAKVLTVINDIRPDVIYMPHFGDMQKDHLITSEAVMVAVRPKGNHIVRYVYSYETLSETEWNIPHAANSFIANVFFDITDTLKDKLRALGCYKSQVADFPNPRSLEAVESLAKYRGSTMGSMAAEAFMLIREYKKNE